MGEMADDDFANLDDDEAERIAQGYDFGSYRPRPRAPVKRWIRIEATLSIDSETMGFSIRTTASVWAATGSEAMKALRLELRGGFHFRVLED
jgi:hypothetical protein